VVMCEQDVGRPVSKRAKPYKGIAMEGVIARWYTQIRSEDQELQKDVRLVTHRLAAGSRVLEVAPGPGFFAIELARQGSWRVDGLDISGSFVRIARAKAKEAGLPVEFHQGSASSMPFQVGTFDFVVCRAAFKNFSEPIQALCEMHRVLKPGGRALIIDLRRDASVEGIHTHIDDLRLGVINRLLTQWTFRWILLKNAYTAGQIHRMVAQTPFVQCEIRENAIGMEIWLGN
jgi:ubiquinone/menaquinone biosynthesis C-methylase UbiE